MSPTILTGTESKRLEKLEASIRHGQKTFVEIGLALATIRDERLYRSDFPTFQDYCKERWGWDRQRAIQLINSAAVVKSLPDNVKHVLQNDRQACELAKVEPDKREEVLAKAAKSGSVTAKSIRSAAEPEIESESEAAPVRILTAEFKSDSVPSNNPYRVRIFQLVNDIADETEKDVKEAAIAMLEKQVAWLKGN